MVIYIFVMFLPIVIINKGNNIMITQDFLTVEALLNLLKDKNITVYGWVKIFNDGGSYIKLNKVNLRQSLKTDDKSELEEVTSAVLRNGQIFIN